MENKFTIEVRAKGFGKLKNEVNKSKEALDGLEQKTKRQRRATRGLERAIGGIRNSFLLAAFATAGFTKAIGTVVGASSRFESVKTRLVGLTGSVQKANIAFDNFNSVAATTPFSLEDVVGAGAQLQAFGADANALIKPITDLAAFMGTTAVEAANSFGRAYAAGAGAADILREKGILNIIKSSQGISDLSKTTLPQFRQALVNAIQDPVVGIEGSTDRLSKTTEGSISNMNDAFTRLAVAFGDRLKPMTDATIKSLTMLANGLRVITEIKPEPTVAELTSAFVELNKDLERNEKSFELLNNTVFTVDEVFTKTRATTEATAAAYQDFQHHTMDLDAAIIKENSSLVTQNNLLETHRQLIIEDTTAALNQLIAKQENAKADEILRMNLSEIFELQKSITGQNDDRLKSLEAVKELEPFDPINNALSVLSVKQSAAIGLTNKLSQNFIQAGLNGQKMGEAVITSLKSIAAEIAAQAITFGLLKSFFAPGTLGMGLGDFVLRGFGVRHQGGPVQKFNSGGMVQGRDNVPILAQAGEFIIKRDSAQSIGLDALNKMNETGETPKSINIIIQGGLVDQDYISDTLIPALNASGEALA